GIIADKIYIFATIYVTNRHQATFLKGTLTKLRDFTEGTLLVGGDFNTPLDPTLDSSSGHSCIPQRNIRSIRNSLNNLGLVDCCRAINPSSKDFTHYSALHDRYARIDYLFVKQEGLSRLIKATIEPATCSDHNPVRIDL
ncbi:Hypothetical predicted protein, partial [Pelobates cultripes]